MKRVFFESGRPEVLTDYFTTIEQNVAEGIGVLLQSLGDCIILTNNFLAIAGTTWTIDGWCYYDGKIIRAPHQTISSVSTGDVIIAYTEDIAIANNPEVYKDGNTHTLVKEVVLKFKKKTSETFYKQLAWSGGDFKMVVTSLINAMDAITDEGVAIDGVGLTLNTGVADAGSPGFSIKKTIYKTLIINGYLAGLPATAVTVAGVPNCKYILQVDAKYRPATITYFTAQIGFAGAYSDIPVYGSFMLTNDGKLYYRQATTAFNPDINFAKAVVHLS